MRNFDPDLRLRTSHAEQTDSPLCYGPQYTVAVGEIENLFGEVCSRQTQKTAEQWSTNISKDRHMKLSAAGILVRGNWGSAMITVRVTSQA